MVDTLPALGLPGARSEPAGEYGWTGTRGSKSGMHSVIENESSPDGFRHTSLFRRRERLLSYRTGCRSDSGDGAALYGLYLEPYDDPNVLFMSLAAGRRREPTPCRSVNERCAPTSRGTLRLRRTD